MKKARKAILVVFSILLCLTLVTLVRAALPGEVTGVVWCGAQCLQWDASAGATSYRVYRGETASERCLVTSALDSCRAGSSYTVPTTGAGAIPENPGSGRFYWYLVTAILESGEGTSGNARIAGDPVARIRNDSGGCPSSCSASGQACSTSGDCCSSLCFGTCASACDCLLAGAQCVSHADCCSGFCDSGVCTDVCGNGVIHGNEQCDDGNQTAGDGCSPVCTGESGYACSGEPSICTPCPAGFANCNGGSQDGCEADLSSPSSCGACDVVCPAGICIDGTCGCSPTGHSCQAPNNCCPSNVCVSNLCCKFTGASCTVSDFCCFGNSCNNGICCGGGGTPCTPGVVCCPGLVCGVLGACQPCLPSGSACSTFSTCCNGTVCPITRRCP